MTFRDRLVVLLVVALLMGAYGSVVYSFTYGHEANPATVIVSPSANGTTTDWVKSHADSAFYQCVNQITANDNDWWALPFTAGGAFVDTIPPTANGSTTNWAKSHADSAFYQCVNEVSPNDADFWYWTPATAGFSTFGYTTAATSNQGVGASWTGTVYTPTNGVVIDSLTYYVGTSTQTVWFQGSIYKRSDLSLQFCSDSLSVASSTTQWLSFPAQLQVSNVQYLFGLFARNTSGSELWKYGATVGTTPADTFSLDIVPVFGACESAVTIATTQGARRGSFYATYHTPGTVNLVATDIDTLNTTDSVVTVVRAVHTGSATVNLEVVADTNGTVYPIDTVAVTSSLTTFRCTKISGLTDRLYQMLQLGVRQLGEPDIGDSIKVTWLVPIVYGTSPSSDSTKVCMVETDADTGDGWYTSDSVRIYLRGCHTGTGSRRVEIMYDSVGDGSGLRAADTATFQGSRTFGSVLSKRRGTTWTKQMLLNLEVGVRGLDAAEDGDSILISWISVRWYRSDSAIDLGHRIFTDTTDIVVGQVSSYEPYDDIWDSSAVTIGRDFPGKNRAFIVFTNPDSLTRKPVAGSERVEVDSAFLYLMVDTVIGVPTYVYLRQISPSAESLKAVYKSTTEDATYCHSDWDSRMASAEGGTQSCTDTIQWAKLGADSSLSDYLPDIFSPDTVAVDSTGGGETTLRFDVSPWLANIHAAGSSLRQGFNGLQLLSPTVEDSGGQHYVKIGTVRPFKDSDSLWLETFVTVYSVADADPPGVLTWNDTAYFSLASLGPSGSQYNGWWGYGIPYTGKINSSYHYHVGVALNDAAWMDYGSYVKRLPDPADSVVTAAYLYLVRSNVVGASDSLRVHLFTPRSNTPPRDEESVYGRPRINNSTTAGQYHHTDGQYRLAVGSVGDSTSSNSANRPWLPGYPSWDSISTDGDGMDIWPNLKIDSLLPPAKTWSSPNTADTVIINITQWFDSLQYGAGSSMEERMRRHNGILLFDKRASGGNNKYSQYRNVSPLASGAATYIKILLEETGAPPAAPSRTPRNRLRGGKGVKGDKRDFDRPSLGEQQPDFTPGDSTRIVIVGEEESP